MKKNILILIVMILIIPLAGELKFYPFHDTFRVSLGVPIFFLFLLGSRKLPLIVSGFIVGISVVIFRIVLEVSTKVSFQLNHTFMLHFPTLFYYVTYSCLFYFTNISNLLDRPLLLGLLSVVIEIASSIVELSLRHLLLDDIISLSILGQLIIIAIIRSFFVLGIFSTLRVYEAELKFKQQQSQNRHMLFLISNLYEESIHLKKTLQNAEDITRNCYNIYKHLQDSNVPIKREALSQRLLGIAGEVHEIKKDNQRIYAGLSNMISKENSTDYMNIEEICNIILQINEKYASSLGKEVKFDLNIKGSFPPFHVYTILSLINNLVSNSVEAIINNGLVKINVYKIGQYVEFRIFDNGPGIPQKKNQLIFKPGYTTKYDISGKPSTGMGLPYVKEVVENLNGSIILQGEAKLRETVLIVQLPINSLVKKG